MAKKEDIDLIEALFRKTSKKMAEVINDKSFFEHVDNLTKKEFETLFTIGKEGNKTMGEIAEKLCVTISTPTTTVDRLIKKGYVKREVGKKDRRKVLVSLTDVGARLYDQLLGARLKNLEIILDALSEEELNVFRTILKKLNREI